MAGLNVTPQFTAVVQVRKASSSCCAAKLGLGQPGTSPPWVCLACCQPCERVEGEPQEVEAHG